MNSEIEFQTLLLLAKQGAQERQVEVSLSELAKSLGASKQTAARRLSDLEGRGLITKIHRPKGQALRITPAGLAALRAVHSELGKVFKSSSGPIKVSGIVSEGLGEGGYYMAQENYKRRFKEELDFIPYPGTLDVRLDEKSLPVRELLSKMPGREIAGFEEGGRTFGAVKFFPAKLGRAKGAVVMPARGHHKDMLEFVSEKNLRKTMKLNDGDLVEIEVIA
ncbi:MAG: DUF120 domain-containing protein [Candidatus Hadarchaeota archaeon]